MINDLGFKQIEVPFVSDCPEGPRISIFATHGCLDAENLLVIFPSGKTMPGIWSRSLCIEKGLQYGIFCILFLRFRNNVAIFHKSYSAGAWSYCTQSK